MPAPTAYLFEHFQHGFEIPPASQTLSPDVSVHTRTKTNLFPQVRLLLPMGINHRSKFQSKSHKLDTYLQWRWTWRNLYSECFLSGWSLSTSTSSLASAGCREDLRSSTVLSRSLCTHTHRSTGSICPWEAGDPLVSTLQAGKQSMVSTNCGFVITWLKFLNRSKAERHKGKRRRNGRKNASAHAGWVLVGSDVAFMGQLLLTMKEKKKSRTQCGFDF